MLASTKNHFSIQGNSCQFSEEEKRPLHFPAGALGLARPVLVGEVDPTDVARKLDTIHADGHDGALFWSHLGLDGYTVDLDAIHRWVQSKTGARERE